MLAKPTNHNRHPPPTTVNKSPRTFSQRCHGFAAWRGEVQADQTYEGVGRTPNCQHPLTFVVVLFVVGYRVAHCRSDVELPGRTISSVSPHLTAICVLHSGHTIVAAARLPQECIFCGLSAPPQRPVLQSSVDCRGR